MTQVHFRFETLEVWRLGFSLADNLLEIVQDLQSRRRYALADQLARAAISVPNNIAEGSGSFSKREFAHFLSISRRSLFECANLILLLEKRGLLGRADSGDLLRRVDMLSRKLTMFRRHVLRARAGGTR